MRKRNFLNTISNAQEDILQQFLDLLNKINADYCVIGGLGVNAYVEPVVSLDLDIVVVNDSVDSLIKEAYKNFKIEKFQHSINLTNSKSELRLQVQTDPRYQVFISRSSLKSVMGYEMKVASLKDILQGKIWAYLDEERRESKRQKDLADIYRIIEAFPDLKDCVPEKMIQGLR
ncbi:nucleotidyl transferase AbiEii/AbiGii toxin family protein [bacterium]|nr:nucleotidyl transferase AbiEii/AbiGii toxin family protein [bacterium]